jgi:hypothetical protein
VLDDPVGGRGGAGGGDHDGQHHYHLFADHVMPVFTQAEQDATNAGSMS